MSSRLLTEPAAARYLGIARRTLRDLRCRGVVPAQQVTIRAALYDTDDLDAHVLASTPHRTLTVGNETITLIYDEEAP